MLTNLRYNDNIKSHKKGVRNIGRKDLNFRFVWKEMEVKEEYWKKKNEIRRIFGLSKQGEMQLRKQMQMFCGLHKRYPPDAIRIYDRCHPEYYLPMLVDFLQNRAALLDEYNTRKYERTGKYKNDKKNNG
jgi:hypothetical protein